MTDHDGARSRRGVIAAGLGAVLAGGAASFAGAPPAVAQGAAAEGGLPVVRPGDDWAEVLARTPRVQLEPGTVYTLGATVSLPSGCLVVGNGATVTVADVGLTAFEITRRTDVTLTGVRLVGRAADPAGSAPVFAHVGVRVTRSSDVRVTGCDFVSWRGAGVVVTGSVSDAYMEYRTQVAGNTFHRCYFGLSLTDRAEYGSCRGNTFTGCRLAIWASSGNWNVADNVVVSCDGAYYAIAATSPYGALASDNWNHGSVVGNTFNHASAGGDGWGSHLAFPLGGSPRDPGSGVVVEGLLPPTFAGNTLWYTDITASHLAGTRWLLSGCTMSNLTIRQSGTVPVHLVGTQANGEQNLPRTVGEVKDLLAGLG